MRYETRFANGSWRVFDTFFYATLSLCRSKVDADTETAWLNSELAKRGA